MPIRSKRSRRRDNKAELDGWKVFFSSGFDFFEDLASLGVETNRYGVPDKGVAREAWNRLGAEFLRTWNDQIPQYGHHALRVFGEPPREKRRAGA